MSDVSHGGSWWQASEGKWYLPEQWLDSSPLPPPASLLPPPPASPLPPPAQQTTPGEIPRTVVPGHAGPPHEPAQRPRLAGRWNRRTISLAAAGVLVLAIIALAVSMLGGGASSPSASARSLASPTRPSSYTIEGVLEDSSSPNYLGPGCIGWDFRGDEVGEGAITVKDGEGYVIGTGTLDGGNKISSDGPCDMDFTISKVPEASYYQLYFYDYDTGATLLGATYSKAQLKQDRWTVGVDVEGVWVPDEDQVGQFSKFTPHTCPGGVLMAVCPSG